VQALSVDRIDAGPTDGVAWVDEEYEGVPIRRLSVNLGAAPDRARWEYANPWIGDHLKAFLRSYRPDLFHLVSGYLLSGTALLAAHDEGIPSVISLTDYWFLCPRINMLRSDGALSGLPIDPATCAQCLGEERRRYKIPGGLAPGLMRAYWKGRRSEVDSLKARSLFLTEALNQADALMSPSEYLRSIYRQAGPVPEDFSVIPHGTDLPRVAPDQVRKRESDALRIGYLGQIAWHKGIHVLVEAVRRMAGAPMKLEIYGDTSRFPDYARRLQQLSQGDPRIRMAGAYGGQSELPSILRDLDVVVVPSVWYENCPNVILEAFVHRIPVIATNLGGMAEMVSHGRSGLLFRVGDAADLAAQLRRLLSEPGLLPALRDGIPPVKTFADEVAEIEAVYRRILPVRSAAPVHT
jgi:glycosyltransferase involved in cell wall biosynthesis